MGQRNGNGNGGGMIQRKDQVNDLRKYLYGAKGQLELAFEKTMDPDRVIRLCLTAVNKNPGLLQCTPESVALALMTAGQLGLEIDGRNAHLVPFKNQCQLIPDYKGLVQLAYKSGMIEKIVARPVYENDLYEFEFGTNENLRHVPAKEGRGNLYAAYTLVKLKGCAVEFYAYDKTDILKRKNASRSATKSDSPWQNWEAEMWAKTAIKMTAPFLPLGDKFGMAIDHDNAMDAGKTSPLLLPSVPPANAKTKSDQLAGMIDGDFTDPNEGSQEVPDPIDDPQLDLAGRIESAIAEATTEETLQELAADIGASQQENAISPEQAKQLTKLLNERFTKLPTNAKG